MSTYKELRDLWIPDDARIILETDNSEDTIHVVYTHEGILRVCRFFLLSFTNLWNASVDAELSVRDLI